MAKKKAFRFAVGTPEKSFSGVWRIVVSGSDVYLGSSKSSMGQIKISLHKSGVWTFAATSQSGITFEDGNRRMKEWKRPAEHTKGVCRGPSIYAPHTSLGSRRMPADEGDKKIKWYPAPVAGQTVEFSIYFVKKGTTIQWDEGQSTLAILTLASGDLVYLLAQVDSSGDEFEATVEKQLRENIFRSDNPDSIRRNRLYWVTQSRDELRIPIIVDMPLPVGLNLTVSGAVKKAIKNSSDGN